MHIKVDLERLKKNLNAIMRASVFFISLQLIARSIYVFYDINSYNNPIISIIMPIAKTLILALPFAIFINIIYLKVENIIKFGDTKD